MESGRPRAILQMEAARSSLGDFSEALVIAALEFVALISAVLYWICLFAHFLTDRSPAQVSLATRRLWYIGTHLQIVLWVAVVSSTLNIAGLQNRPRSISFDADIYTTFDYFEIAPHTSETMYLTHRIFRGPILYLISY